MKLTSSASAVQVHPRTLERKPCMVFKFDTGHGFVRWSDFEWHYNKAGKSLNPRSGVKLIAQMRALAEQGL